MVCLLASTMLFPLASAFEELELQAATDALSAEGFATVDHTFWRSSFGAPMIGGPTFAGNASDYSTFRTSAESDSGGIFPTGALPVFIEFQSLSNVTYASGNGSDTDYSTQQWSFTNSSRVAGSASLGAGAAAQAAWAQDLLRTNHYANGTQDPTGPFVGASNDTGLLGVFLIQALSDRVAAIRGGAAYNGSALQAFNFSDPNLTDADAANGYQVVPDAMGVSISGSSVFLGFTANTNTSSLRGQAALILGLAEVLRVSDPAGSWGGLFDGAPFGPALYNDSRELLAAVANNAHAYHWDATAGTYREPDQPSVDTGDLAMFARSLAVAEAAAANDGALKDQLGALRAKATGALASVAGVGGRYPASYTVSGSTVTPNTANTTLWAQAQAVEAWAASFAVTGLKSDNDATLRASAGLESALYRGGSYAAKTPEGTSTTYASSAVAALIGALRDLSLTAQEPLAVYRFVDAFDTLVAAPPLALSASQSPPIVGSSFAYNATSGTASAATGFNAFSSMLAAYEFASTGARFNAAVGGGVFITEDASAMLHNATATQVGTAIDALDQQLADLQGQLSALQAAFDAINGTASDVEQRLNLSLENETISQARIQDLIDNVTALRDQVNSTVGEAANATSLYANLSQMYNASRLEVANLTYDLAAWQNLTSNATGDLNLTREQLEAAQENEAQMRDQLNEAQNQRNAAQAGAAVGVLAGLLAGFALFYVISRYVLTKPLGPAPKDEGGKDDDDGDADD